jgi:hypothetical protein
VDGEDWQGELGALIDRAAAVEGRDVVAAVLRGHSERLFEDTGMPSVVVAVPVLGAVTTGTGWVGVLLAPERPPAVLAAGTLGTLAELARESADVAIAAIGTSTELADVERRERGGQVEALSTVVEVIEVDPVARFTKMAEGRVRTGREGTGATEGTEGAAERRALLASTGLTPPAWFRGSGFREEDLLDACAAAWTAVRRLHGDAECVSLPSTTLWV